MLLQATWICVTFVDSFRLPLCKHFVFRFDYDSELDFGPHIFRLQMFGKSELNCIWDCFVLSDNNGPLIQTFCEYVYDH